MRRDLSWRPRLPSNTTIAANRANLCNATGDDGGTANMARFIPGDPTDRTVADLMTTEKRRHTGLSPRSWEVIEAVRNADGPVTPRDIANEVDGISNKDAGQYLARLAEANILTKCGRGQYIYRMV